MIARGEGNRLLEGGEKFLYDLDVWLFTGNRRILAAVNDMMVPHAW
jgi:hypothetical protein